MPFKAILKELVEVTPGASGAILADWEGEAVEQCCHYDDFELKVIGAHKGIILNQMKEIHGRFPAGSRTARARILSPVPTAVGTVKRPSTRTDRGFTACSRMMVGP